MKMLSFNDLTCARCHEIFNMTSRIPRLLTECGHTLCTSCISLLLSQSDSGFPCSEDGIICGADKKEAAEFPKNLSLIGILENEAARRKKQNEGMCSIHKKRLELMCMDCKVRLCSKCAIFDGHRSHQLRSEDDVHSEAMIRKNLLQDMLRRIIVNGDWISHKESTKSAYERYETKEKEMRSLVEERFAEYFEILSSKKARVLKIIDDISLSIKEKFKMIEALSRCTEEWRTEYGLCLFELEPTSNSAPPTGRTS
eukprot:TRINITY_DN2852_c0_g1_i4.p1 TRINITY_DN2852_c0_g1~~TRINITY_DN2852_c0_g1_i4.p1  ORF type:complete len:255 (+),score=58.87 TRINITY_DN2852_c0_g1_i4:164-928(+)